MKILISPAKRMDFSTPYPSVEPTEARFQKEIAQVATVLKELSPPTLSALMGISSALAETSWQYHQDLSLPFTLDKARPALFAYHGDVYEGLEAYTLSREQISQLQGSLRILSGLYGLLKPLDLIAAYRLEMGVKLAIGEATDLYDFWSERITQALNEELQEGELVVNLASDQYFKAIDTTNLKTPVVHIVFKDWKGDTLKTIVYYTKKARGQMVRYITEHNITTIEDLKGFDTGGYTFAEQLSENQLLFVR